MGCCRQLKFLLWKNCKIRKRQKVALVIEILVPLFLFSVLILMRTMTSKQPVDQSYFLAKSMPSAGFLPFHVSYLCSFEYGWRHSSSPDGDVSFSYSKNSLLKTFSELVRSSIESEDSVDDVNSFLDHLRELVKAVNNVSSPVIEISVKMSTLFQNKSAFIPLAEKHGLPEATAKGWAESSLTPKFFVRFAKIMFDHDINLTNPLNDFEMLDKAVKDIQQLYCNITDEISTEICDWDKWSAFWKDALELKQCPFDNSTVFSKLKDVLQNVTGGRMKVDDTTFISLIETFAFLSKEITTRSTFGKFAETLQLLFNNQGPDFYETVCGAELFLYGAKDAEIDVRLKGIEQTGYNDKDDFFHFADKIIGNMSSYENKTNKNDCDGGGTKMHNFVCVNPSEENRCWAAVKSAYSGSINGSMLVQIYTLLRGFIVVTPEHTIVEKTLQKLNLWFNDGMSIIKNMADKLDNSSDGFLQNSKLKDTLEKLQAAMIQINEISDIFPKTKIEVVNNTIVSYFNETHFSQLKNRFRNFINIMKCFRTTDRLKYVANESELEEVAVRLSDLYLYFGGVVFDLPKTSDSSPPQLIRYKIRMANYLVDKTESVIDKFWTPYPRAQPLHLQYIYFGFSFLQDFVDAGLIRLQTNRSSKVGLYAQQIPNPCFMADSFVPIIETTLPLLMVLSWMLTVAIIVRNVVQEKQSGLKEFMKVMGLNNAVHWLGWYFQNLILMLVSIILMLIIFKVPIKILEYSDVSILFVFLMLFATALITHSFLISTLFNRATFAGVCISIIYFLLFLPYMFLSAYDVSAVVKICSCLLPQIALGWGFHYVAYWEKVMEGIQWSNFWYSPIYKDEFNFGIIMGMLLVDSILNMLLTMYIETVCPGEYGIAQPFYFICSPSYWFGGKKDSQNKSVETPEGTLKEFVESEPRGMPLGVSVINLRKVFTKRKAAVDGLNLNFYENQITSFLGHNGAGKTTTMSILTGLIPPTSGTVMVLGQDIRRHMPEIRNSLGLCPQHNILFDKLTVDEHLRFYAGLKGVEKTQMDAHVEQMLQYVRLVDKKDEFSKNLSGGMKRRLSIAIAFLGNSKVIVLDEPTAGVDPSARHDIWDMLLRSKTGRTIIMSTHHMDEADILGDRIAIIAKGQLKCCGSSLFLKKLYGSGLYLTIVLQSKLRTTKSTGDLSVESTGSPRVSGDVPSPLAKSQSLHDVSNDYNTDAISKFVISKLPNSKFVEHVGQEIKFLLPDTDPKLLCDFFPKLDKNLKPLGITTYGVSETKMEEIFLKATSSGPELKDGNIQFNDNRGKKKSKVAKTKTVSPDAVPKKAKCLRQCAAVFVKRFINFRRNLKGAFCEIVVPLLLIAVAYLTLLFPLQYAVIEDQKPMILTPWLYGPPNYIFYSTSDYGNTSDDLLEREYIESMVLDPPGFGCRCMSNEPFADLPCKPAGRKKFGATSYEDVKIDESVCKCSNESLYCPSSAYDPEPPNQLMDSTDYAVNMTKLNISQWLMMTEKRYRYKRYGGFSFTDENSDEIDNDLESDFIDNAMVLWKSMSKFFDDFGISWKLTNTSEINRDTVETLVSGLNFKNNIKVWFNNRAFHAFPAYMNTINNAILRSKLQKDKTSQYGIITTNHPMKYSKSQRDQITISSTGLSKSALLLLLVLTIILAFSIIPASFVMFLINERTSQAKHLQFVSGLDPNLYWLMNYFWDLINFLFPVVGTIIVFVIFQKYSLIHEALKYGLVDSIHSGFATFLVLFLYGFAVIPQMYLFSFMFSSPTTAFIALSIANFLIAIIAMLVSFNLEGQLQEKEIDPSLIILPMLFLPQGSFVRGLLWLIILRYNPPKGQMDLIDKPFAWETMGQMFLSMFISGVVAMLFILLIEFLLRCQGRCLNKKPEPPPADEDEDVRKERERVANAPLGQMAVAMMNFTKVYSGCSCRSFKAVNNLSVAINRGECFGLLGVNGAGKTTAFKMLTGEVSITSGDAYFSGFSVVNDLYKVRQQIGFCPQFDALNFNLTAREQIFFYARLRGIPESEIKKLADEMILRLALTEFADQTSGTYSGGNKRKLSTAIALIGDPPVVMLDEPSSGMDPGARRFLWNKISEVVQEGRSVILTSQYMEECEALCNRLAIMVNGRFQCLGSVQHLKSRFGQGYTLTLRFPSVNPKTEEAAGLVAAQFPAAVLKERLHAQLQYRLPSMKLSEVFQFVVQLRERMEVEDYSLVQTTLDEVFIGFARQQHSGKEKKQSKVTAK